MRVRSMRNTTVPCLKLRQALDHTSMANGYANRFLFACVRRSKSLPHGGALDQEIYRKLGARTLEALTAARTVERLTMTDAANQHWKNIYQTLSEGLPGLLGAITDHLDAALALWNFCVASARYIFGDIVGNPVADTVLRALRAAGADGLSRTGLRAETCLLTRSTLPSSRC